MNRPVPPLPPSWPYAPRPSTGAVAGQDQVALPGLPGHWTLHAVPGLALGDRTASGLTGAFGRGGVLRAGDLVLRPYRRGGLVRHLNPDVYGSPARFEREFQVHQALWEAGLPTVEPLGWAHRPRAWGVEGVYLTRFQEGTPWPRAWDRLEVLPQIRTLLEALCAWGLLAPDLNATNFHVTEGGLLALDWDGARWAPGSNLRPHYHERLIRSLRKLGAPGALLAVFQAP